MANSSITIHDIKSVDLKKNETLEEDGTMRFTTLDIEMKSKEGIFRITAFLDTKGEDGYSVNLVQNYKTRTGSYELVRVFLCP